VSFDQVVMDSVSHVTKLVGAAGNLFGPPPQSPAVSPTIDGGGGSGGGGGTNPTYPLPPGHAPIAAPPPPAPPPAPPAGPGPPNGGLPGGANQAGTTYNKGTANVSAIDEKLAAKLKEIFAANRAVSPSSVLPDLGPQTLNRVGFDTGFMVEASRCRPRRRPRPNPGGDHTALPRTTARLATFDKHHRHDPHSSDSIHRLVGRTDHEH